MTDKHFHVRPSDPVYELSALFSWLIAARLIFVPEALQPWPESSEATGINFEPLSCLPLTERKPLTEFIEDPRKFSAKKPQHNIEAFTQNWVSLALMNDFFLLRAILDFWGFQLASRDLYSASCGRDSVPNVTNMLSLTTRRKQPSRGGNRSEKADKFSHEQKFGSNVRLWAA